MLKPIPSSQKAPEPCDFRKIEKKRDYVKCKKPTGPYWTTEGILNQKLLYDKDVLNPQHFMANIWHHKVSG